MGAYVIIDTQISDSDAHEAHRAMARGLVARCGGTYLVRDGDLDVDEDDLWSPSRIVLIEFADLEAARAFVDSEDYKRTKTYQNCTVLVVDGIGKNDDI